MFGLNGRLPDVLWDGYVNTGRAQGPQICVDGVSGVLNADGPNKNANPTSDLAPFKCTLDKLPAVELKQG